MGLPDWPQADKDQLTGLWADGMTTEKIATRMNRTKNGIIGKAHRLGLPARPSPIRTGPAAPAPVPRVTGPTLPSTPSAMASVPDVAPAIDVPVGRGFVPLDSPYTLARRTLILTLYPDNDLAEVRRRCEASPGPPMPGTELIRAWAHHHGAKRSAQWNNMARARASEARWADGRGTPWTPERKALVTALYPDTDLGDLHSRLSALPGPAIGSPGSIVKKAAKLGAFRSAAWMDTQNKRRERPNMALDPAPSPAPRPATHRPAHDFGHFFEAAGEAPRPHRIAPMPQVMSRSLGRVITCQWPIGEPGTRDFHFCDVPSEPARPYCEDHLKVAYVRVRDRHEDAA